MKKIAIALCALTLVSQQSIAQSKKTTTKTTAKAADTKIKATAVAGYTTLPSGMQYKIVKDAPGGVKPSVGDYVEVHLTTMVDDSVIFETRRMNNNNAVQFPLQAPAFNGSLEEGIMLLTAGDSAIFRVSIDTLIKAGSPSMGWMKPGTNQKLVYHVNMVSVKTAGDMQKEMQAKAAQQNITDDKLLQEYFTKNNIKATKTASGLYYTIERQGTGPKPQVGQNVTMNYTGKLLDGELFDSNVDPKFQHVQPFVFPLGQRQVIQGWDEGIALLNKGTKGTLYIPSSLAYGANGQGPIKANSVLIFDVEVVDVSTEAPVKN